VGVANNTEQKHNFSHCSTACVFMVEVLPPDVSSLQIGFTDFLLMTSHTCMLQTKHDYDRARAFLSACFYNSPSLMPSLELWTLGRPTEMSTPIKNTKHNAQLTYSSQ